MRSLTKQEVINVIEGKRTTERIPNLCSFWIYPGSFEGQEEEMRQWLAEQAYDISVQGVRMPDVCRGTEEDPEYCWLPAGREGKTEGGIDSQVYLEDWEDTELVEEMYAKFPSPDTANIFPGKEKIDHAKYVVGHWFYCLFERQWSIRGMENALTDFYLYPEEVHRLYQKLTDFYIRIMERFREECGADGIFTSDDIGTQTGPFFSLEIFRTFFKPYYKQIIDKAHELGMHFWLHTCGNITEIIGDLIECGLSVLHPIQKRTMDWDKVAAEWKGKIAFWVGMDVQDTLINGSPEDVRKEVRLMRDTFDSPEGGFLYAAGNGIVGGTPIENIDAFLDEILTYGNG